MWNHWNYTVHMYSILTETVETLHQTTLVVFISLLDMCIFYPILSAFGWEIAKENWMENKPGVTFSFPFFHVIFSINDWLIFSTLFKGQLYNVICQLYLSFKREVWKRFPHEKKLVQKHGGLGSESSWSPRWPEKREHDSFIRTFTLCCMKMME